MYRFRSVLLLIFLVCFLVPTQALAERTYSTPSWEPDSRYAWAENPDGTFTEWFSPTGSTDGAIRGMTYSPAAYESMTRTFEEVAANSGTSGNTAADVAGATSSTENAAENVTNTLRTGTTYQTAGEAQVGGEFVAGAESSDFLPSAATVFTDMSSFSIVGQGFLAGVAIGSTIDELFGLPTPFSLLSPTGWGSGAFTYTGYWTGAYKNYINGFGGVVVSCGSTTCPVLEETGEVKESEKGNIVSSGDYGLTSLPFSVSSGACFAFETCAFGTTYPPNVHIVRIVEGGYNQETFTAQVSANGMTPSEVAKSESGGITAQVGYPAPKLNEQATKVSKTEVPKMEHVKTPVPVPLPSTVPAPARTYLVPPLEKSGAIKPEKEEKEEGKPLPSPLLPVIPEPGHDEVYTEYKTRLETAGFTGSDVSERVLPESAIDTSVGPNDVASVSPAPGTATAPTTSIDVSVNPSDAPIPGESLGGIGPPSEPGLKLPSFGVLCKGFPFGVPCWLAETIGAWSATAKAPEWGVEGLEVKGHKIENLKVNLAKLEGIMEVVRPAMLIFATIGLVLLFFRFAKGGGPPSGSQGDNNTQTYAEEQGSFMSEG